MKGCGIQVIRNGKKVYVGMLDSLKRVKENVKEVWVPMPELFSTDFLFAIWFRTCQQKIIIFLYFFLDLIKLLFLSQKEYR